MLRHNEVDMLEELCGTLGVSGTEKGKVPSESGTNPQRAP